MRRACLTSMMLLLICASVSPVWALDSPYDDVVDVVADTWFTLFDGVDSLRVPCFSNRDPEDDPALFTRVVVSLHGTLRNGDDYFNHMMSAATSADSSQKHTIVYSPQFLIEADVVEHDLADNVPYWEYMGWRQGDLSLSTPENPRPRTISSFAVMDSMLCLLATEYANLDSIVLIGHSAGGQFINRYAAGNRIEDLLTGEHGISLRYIVSNPSTYLYFDTTRWVQGTAYELAEVDTADCPEFNDYKYGLNNRNGYMSLPEATLRAQYAEREVIYLLGERDDDHYSSWLDKSCPAMLQGTHRLQRGIIYFEHLQNVFGPGIAERHALVIAEGVGHSHTSIFNSSCGLHYLFDHGGCVALPLAENWAEISTGGCVYRAGMMSTWTDHDQDDYLDLYLSSSSQGNMLLLNNRNDTFRELSLPPLDDPNIAVGAASIDYDNDGDLDIALLNADGGKLFRRESDGYDDVTTEIWFGESDYLDMDWVDFDNDGDLDVYLCRSGGQPNRMLINDNGVFSEAVDLEILIANCTLCALWADYDSDGDADLYLGVSGGGNFLFRNDGGHFTNVTSPVTGTRFDTNAACWGDYDNDGDPDLYLGNGPGNNRLLRNDGGSVFNDVTTELLSSPGRHTKSAAWQDFDNDGRLDLYLSNSIGNSCLLRNMGDGSFEEQGGYPLLNLATTAACGDIDADGDSDLYLTNALYVNILLLNTLDEGNHWLQVRLLGDQSNGYGVGARVELVAAGLKQTRQIGLSDSGPFVQTPLYAAFGLGSASVVDTMRVLWPSGVDQEFINVPTDRFMRVSEDTGLTAIVEAPAIPQPVLMLPCSPNPFNPTTIINFVLPVPLSVSLSIFDVQGRLVRVLAARKLLPAGRRGIEWNGRDGDGALVPTGVYFARLETGNGAETGRMVLIK
ncbi:MAG: T9SS type A sorting domain-containing protein [bacterium]|nr:T9SS type A sorting domain-containing protein [bacterium]